MLHVQCLTTHLGLLLTNNSSGEVMLLSDEACAIFTSLNQDEVTLTSISDKKTHSQYNAYGITPFENYNHG